MRHALLVIVSLLFSSQLAQAQFTQQAKLFDKNAVGAEQGISVALSSDGNTAIVGGPLDSSSTGAAWVYARINGVWSQQQKLVGTGAIGNAQQGSSVALSSDGNTAIVGGPRDNSDTGAAWVFTRNSMGVWSQQQKLVGTGAIGNAQQGSSVALSSDGNTAIVGGPRDNGASGAAWVFTRSGTMWSQQQKLVGTGAIGNTQQGFSVSLSSDGNTAIVGGPLDNGASGAAWVFTRSGTMWSQQQKLVGTGALGGPQQGNSVALSSDGNTAIVGGPADSGGLGAAWVFTRNSMGVWSQQQKLVGTGAGGAVGAEQGFSVALSGDGNTAIVGGPLDNNFTGATWVFTRNSMGVWSQQQMLAGTGATGSAEQGWSVALSSDGNTAIVGGIGDNSNAGAAWVFVHPTTVAFSAFTAQLTVYPNQKEFSINSNFTLGPTSNAINPPTEPVTLKIGSFTITIPPGSFVNAGAPGYFTFVGVINGVSLNVLIRQTSGNNYIFGVIAKNVSLTIQNPVSVTLTIGDDSGTTSVNAVIINTG
jgi:hypothetical protein